MAYYDDISQGYNELHSEEQKKKMTIVEAILKRWKAIPEKILDVGCGTGLSTPRGAYGADPSQKLLMQHPGYPDKTVKADAESLPFKDKQFDVVISLTAIHNFHNIREGLEEIKRVGRRYILSVLKKSNRFDDIKEMIHELFSVDEMIDEEKDMIFVCS